MPNVAGGAEGIIAFSVIDSGIGIPVGQAGDHFRSVPAGRRLDEPQVRGNGPGLVHQPGVVRAHRRPYRDRERRRLWQRIYALPAEEAEEETAARPVLEETGAAAEAFLATERQGAKRKEELLAPSIEWSSPELLSPSSLEDDRDSIQKARVLLIIEDDIRFASILLDMARSRHFKALVALEGDKGLALAHAYRPDGILLDIQVPVLDGWSILERLKQHSELRHIPVHVISVVDEPQKGLTMGAMAFLQKPVDKAHIEQALARVESFMSRDLKRLLIVEDDLVLRSSMVELIGHDDVLITAVSTGHEALRELEREHFDCMVLDLGLSDITGFELLDRIRRLVHLKQLPIIIYTGKDLDMREELELKKYAESIIIKNVKSQERLFDETALFLHRVKADMPEDRRQILDRLYNNEAAFDGKRLLLVEDDIRNIFVLSNVLESYNMRISFAENGREALELLEKDPDFDLILMDIMMPEMDGYEAMKAMREDAAIREDADHRADGEGDEGRPSALPGCRRLRLHQQADRYREAAVVVEGVAVYVTLHSDRDYWYNGRTNVLAGGGGGEMNPTIQLSVRALVEYAYRSGDIESGFRTAVSLTEGTKAISACRSSTGNKMNEKYM